MQRAGKFFYGWVLVGVAWLCYGFGISPAYYSWGAFSSEMIADFGLSRTAFNWVWGLFTFLQSGVGPLAGLALSRWGVRKVMTAGSLLAAAGFAWLSRAESLRGCYLGFSILGGAGIGFSSFLPAQTLGQSWFRRYRGTVIGIIMTAGGVVGIGVPLFDAWVLRWSDWRLGWQIISGISLFVALLAVLLIRNTPEEMGMEPDGGRIPPGAAMEAADPTWAPSAAMRTPQFFLITLGGIAYSVPWAVIVGNGRLHLEQIGYSTTGAAAMISTMILVSTLGRLGGSLGDLWSPQKVLAAALALEGAGTLGLMAARSPGTAYSCLILVGLGFGSAYTLVPVVVSAFFGRRAFATTSGVRQLISACVLLVASPLSGIIHDRTGSYDLAFLGLAGVALIGAAAAGAVRAPVLAERRT